MDYLSKYQLQQEKDFLSQLLLKNNPNKVWKPKKGKHPQKTPTANPFALKKGVPSCFKNNDRIFYIEDSLSTSFWNHNQESFLW